MTHHDPQHQHNTLWWITSLAISVTCCAVLFVVFAGYVVNIKEDLAMEKLRLDMADQRFLLLGGQLENLYHRNAQVAPALPLQSVAPVSAPVPATVELPAAAAGAMPGMVTTGTATTPAPVTPPAASPAATPEVPAK